MSNYKQVLVLFGVCIALVTGLAFWAADEKSSSELTFSDFLSDEEVEPLTFEDVGNTTLNSPLVAEELEINNPETVSTMNPVAVFNTSLGVFKIELFEDQMPITVGNFTKLAEEGYYDGIKFHRIIEGFMIQGGDPNTKTDNVASYGTGGPGYTIQDEFVEGELLTNTRGTISMANTGQPNSGGSQFFINTANNERLDFDKPPAQSKHPVFGRITEGMDVVDAIEGVDTIPGPDRPVQPVVIESLVIERQ